MARKFPHAEPRSGAALITGAGSGIGRAMANRLGSLGYELVLVGEKKGDLEAVASEIGAAHGGAAVHVITSDLARPEAAGELHAAVRALDLDIEILISNAGIFFFGEAVDAQPERACSMLQLHVVTPSLLCALLCRDMREKRRGHVLIVSSISAWRDFPGISYYGSSKKYLRGFARALRSELSPFGVNVTCLAPGPTATSLYDSTSVPVQRATRLGIMMDAAEVADSGLHAMFARRAEHIPGFLSRIMALAASVTPQLVIELIRRRVSWLSMPKGAP